MIENSIKERVLNYYKRNKFPITVEPILLFSSIAYGLAEVILLIITKGYNLEIVRS